jgi:dTDP-4-dehydrorhamnose reductase
LKILVLGASGMLGNAVVRVLSENPSLVVFGTVRAESSKQLFTETIASRLFSGIDIEQEESLMKVFLHTCPDVVINCVGLIKQLSDFSDPLQAIPINSMLPHRLARLCEGRARFIHISTDCVFDGRKGDYVESDCADARDLYGMSKYIGEVAYPHSITLRTSIIGHELQSKNSLVEWFLSQGPRCNGFTRAVFSGLPAVVLAQIIRDLVIPDKELSGIYHLAAKPINKYDLLTLIADVYSKSIQIIPDNTLVIDRSLNADKFRIATGYIAPEWPTLIRTMYSYKKSS